jgi:hypothetical protein
MSSSIGIHRGETSIIRSIIILDSMSDVGGGKTGLAHDTGSLVAYYWYPGISAVAALTLETITTLGTYAAPTSNVHIRIKEISAANMPGLYELHFHNDWVSIVNGRKQIVLMLKGASGMVETLLRIELLQPTGIVEIAVEDTDFSPTTTAFEVTGITDATANAYKDCWIKFLTGNNAGEAKKVTASSVVTTNVKLTVDTMQAAPADGDRAIIF